MALPAAEPDASAFTVAGMAFKLGSVKFADAAVALQGFVTAPLLAGLTLAVAGTATSGRSTRG